MSLPLLDGSTWEGSTTGRTWTVHGSGLTRDEFEPTFKFEYAPAVPFPGGWDPFDDYTDKLEAFNFSRRVAGWYLGPRSAIGTVLYNDVAGLQPFEPGGQVRISVTVPAGEFVIFRGPVTDVERVLDGTTYPLVRLRFTDWTGYFSQSEYAASGGPTTASTFSHLSTIIGTGGDTGLDTVKSDNSGVTQILVDGTYNRSDLLHQFLRGEQGMLYADGPGAMVYREVGWFDPHPTVAAAAIGNNQSDPVGDYQYRFPFRRQRPINTLRGQLNDVTWNAPHAPSTPFTTFSLAFAQFGKRKYTDTVLLTLDAQAQAQVETLVTQMSDPGLIVHDIVFPADLSADSMDYAAQADITDFVRVASESLEGLEISWQDTFVMAVAHSWSPAQGWTCTLDTFPLKES